MLERGKIILRPWHWGNGTVRKGDLMINERMPIEWIVDNDIDFNLEPYPNCPQQALGRYITHVLNDTQH